MAYLREVRGMAESTVEGHQIRLRFFLRFWRFDQDRSAIRRLEPDQIDAFLRKSAKTNNRFSTLSHRYGVLLAISTRWVDSHRQIDTPQIEPCAPLKLSSAIKVCGCNLVDFAQSATVVSGPFGVGSILEMLACHQETRC